MLRLGFSERWTRNIMRCVESVSFSVLTNGTPYEDFSLGRGICQGDPLSPYIFCVCAESFVGLLSKGVESQNLKGFHINNFCPPLIHLFFVDDSLIFCRATKEECKVIKDAFKAYELASG